MGWFDMSTLKEPYRLEGKKTMGLELAEQLGWRLPDVILYPTGGGTGLIGMWKAFAELRELGWLQGRQAAAADQLPERRLCADRPRLRGGPALRRAVPQRPHHRQRPARAGRGRRFHDARRHPRQRRLRRRRREGRIVEWMRRVAGREGIAICPETAVCFDCLETLRADGTGRGRTRKSSSSTPGRRRSIPEAVPLDLPRLDKDRPIDYAALAGARP